ncbi:MAG: sigma-70 family RNA polymerase sigma factor [Gemmataceae bacterium]|nr:sigma-70 family RNA polymerase sigma factor [Gemmataceae bacterium]
MSDTVGDHGEQFAGLLRQARAGSESALTAVLESMRRCLLLRADSALRPSQRAKLGLSDLVQETFVDALRNFHDFHGTTAAQLRTWLQRILEHNLQDFVRGQRTAKRNPTREVSLDQLRWRTHLAADTPTPSHNAILEEERQRLRKALDALPESHREVLLLRFKEKLPFKEIARRQGTSEHTIRQQCRRTLGALAPLLGHSASF